MKEAEPWIALISFSGIKSLSVLEDFLSGEQAGHGKPSYHPSPHFNTSSFVTVFPSTVA